MIAKIQIENFKCFKNTTTIDLKNFNVLCGPNSSGKTSITQAILLMMQNNFVGKARVVTNGKFVHFDKFEEIKNIGNDSKMHIKIRIEDGQENESYIEISKSIKSGEIVCDKKINNVKLQEEVNIYYLSADRIGPEDVYERFDTTIGTKGKAAISFIAKNASKALDTKYVNVQTSNTKFTFIDEINYWLKRIIGEEINANDVEQTDRSMATYSKENSPFKVRNKNTGSGLSYVISILAMVFSVSINKNAIHPTFIIENPEIHLHPKAQGELMKFLAFMSKYCQIIVETHSDHIIENAFNCKEGLIIKLENYFPVYFDYGKKRVLPTMTLGEIKWSVFDMPTIDFHVSLFAYLQSLFNENSINKVDDKIRKTATFKQNSELYDTSHERYYKDSNIPKKLESKYETLPVYMRNMIDHPNETTRTKYKNDEDKFVKALKCSIKFMINIIKGLTDTV